MFLRLPCASELPRGWEAHCWAPPQSFWFCRSGLRPESMHSSQFQVLLMLKRRGVRGQHQQFLFASGVPELLRRWWRGTGNLVSQNAVFTLFLCDCDLDWWPGITTVWVSRDVFLNERNIRCRCPGRGSKSDCFKIQFIPALQARCPLWRLFR